MFAFFCFWISHSAWVPLDVLVFDFEGSLDLVAGSSTIDVVVITEGIVAVLSVFDEDSLSGLGFDLELVEAFALVFVEGSLLGLVFDAESLLVFMLGVVAAFFLCFGCGPNSFFDECEDLVCSIWRGCKAFFGILVLDLGFCDVFEAIFAFEVHAFFEGDGSRDNEDDDSYSEMSSVKTDASSIECTVWLEAFIFDVFLLLFLLLFFEIRWCAVSSVVRLIFEFVLVDF